MNTRIRWLSASLLIAGLTAGTSALAAPISVSVPSTPNAAGSVVITGNNLPAFSAVTVRVIHSSGVKTDQVGAVTANGTFSIEYIPNLTGSYSVKVFDQGGRQIGSGTFGYTR